MSDTRGPIARQPVGTAGAAVEDAFHARPLLVWEAHAARVLDLEAVADAARGVFANATLVPGYEPSGLVKIIVHAEDWQALADALDKLGRKERGG